tara:strand:- start:3063 stop:3470 length:408 start_codon:yes stop_codon:yes gene_type:complete
MDITQFPIVFVDFFNITNDINLDDFLNEWKQLYNKQKTFTLVFDTTHITTDISFIKHSYKMIDFISEIKNLPPLLCNSIIIVQNNIIKNFLYFIFQIQSPVSTVYITKPTDINLLLKQISFSKEWYSPDIIKIQP